ncbi:hypothetical protein B0J11DRAFT_399051, partial [Dendryphion nanum]
FESFYDSVDSEYENILLAEAAVRKAVPIVKTLNAREARRVRSGSVIVIEQPSKQGKWKDGRQWDEFSSTKKFRFYRESGSQSRPLTKQVYSCEWKGQCFRIISYSDHGSRLLRPSDDPRLN